MQNPEIRVEHLQRMVPVAEYIESCVDIPKFYACCEACPNFGTRWSCPPFSFSAAEFWSGFETLCLYGRKIYTPETWLAQSYAPEDLAERYHALLKPVKREMMQKLWDMEADQPGSVALSAGSCEICPEGCSRHASLPCRHPEQMRYSIESLGGDVGRSIEMYLGETLLWAESGHLPAHFILLGGLLMKGGL